MAPSFPTLMTADRHFTRRAGEYFSSMRPYGGATGDEDGQLRLRLALIDRRSGTPQTTATFDRFYVQRYTFNDGEATEQIQSGEGEKIYVSDRDSPPLLHLGGFLFDSDLDAVGTRPDEHGLRAWNEFYEQTRLSAIAGTTRYLQADILGVTYIGAFSGMSLTHNSGGPHRFDLACSVICFDVRPARDVAAIPDTDVVGRLTAEGAVQVGLLRPGSVAASTTTQTPGPAMLREMQTRSRTSLAPSAEGFGA